MNRTSDFIDTKYIKSQNIQNHNSKKKQKIRQNKKLRKGE